MDKRPKISERSFGISTGTVLCGIAALLVWRGHITRAEIVGILGAALLVLGLTVPAVLERPNAIWWRLSQVLSRISTRVLLTVLFAFVLTPLSLLWKIVGKDPLQRERRNWGGWSPYPVRYRNNNHYTRMF